MGTLYELMAVVGLLLGAFSVLLSGIAYTTCKQMAAYTSDLEDRIEDLEEPPNDRA